MRNLEKKPEACRTADARKNAQRVNSHAGRLKNEFLRPAIKIGGQVVGIYFMFPSEPNNQITK
jgi:hypothetical protein